jgi:hypothetical protein
MQKITLVDLRVQKRKKDFEFENEFRKEANVFSFKKIEIRNLLHLWIILKN